MLKEQIKTLTPAIEEDSKVIEKNNEYKIIENTASEKAKLRTTYDVQTEDTKAAWNIPN